MQKGQTEAGRAFYSAANCYYAVRGSLLDIIHMGVECKGERVGLAVNCLRIAIKLHVYYMCSVCDSTVL